MKTNKLIILIAVLVLILVVILLAVLNNKQAMTENGALPNYKATTSETPKDNPVEQVQVRGVTEAVAVPEAIKVAESALTQMPGSIDAPRQEIIEENKIPAEAIKLTISKEGFSSKEFTVQAGKPVVLALSNPDDITHIFIFPRASLMGLMTMIGPKETKVISFTAPRAGDYLFRDDILAYRNNTGTMIVK